MTAGAASSPRRTLIRVIAAFMAVSAVAFGLFTIIFGILGPEQEIHAVHNAVVASLLLVLSAPPAIQIVREPARPLRPMVTLGAVAIAGLGTMIAALTLDPFTLPFVALIGVLWAIVPSRDGAVPLVGRASPIMLGLLAVAAVPLLTYALGQAELQRTDQASAHAAFFHWVEASFYAVAVLLLGSLGALWPTEFRLATWCAGAALALLGAASVVLGEHASAIGAPWSWAALVGGVAFIAAGEWEVRRAASATRPAR